jgi:transcriptional regulator with XRE-family HTH domain
VGKKSPTEITGAQVRMARGFLGWSVAELARKAGVGPSSVKRVEASDGSPALLDDLEWRISARNQVISAITDTLLKAGITFLPENSQGVGIRGKIKARQKKP